MAFTYFFRDKQTLDAAVDELARIAMGKQSINIWDAGCAMGPEPFSLAILLAEKVGQYTFRNVKIMATDIDGSDLFKDIIHQGIYPHEQVQRIPEAILAKYFSQVTGRDEYVISDHIRSRISFAKHDLLTFTPPATGFSLIVCKNVLLHFSYEQRIKVIEMFHQTLTPGGLLITEQTQKMPQELAGCFEQVLSNVQLFRKL